MQVKYKKRVGILRGGAGSQYKSSLEKGGEIIFFILQNMSGKCDVFDILVDKDYIWHMNGLPISPSDLAQKVDVVWNVSHPSLSNILDSLSIPNIGINPFSSSISSSREMLKKHIEGVNVEMPRHIVLPVYQKDFDGPIERYSIKKAKEVFEKFSPPWIVQPASPSLGGSLTLNLNMGIHVAKTFPQLISAIEDCVNHGQSILVEEFIAGKIASVHSVTGFRGEDVYAFPPMNVLGDFSVDEKDKLINLAKDLHKHIGAKHYLKSSFVLNRRGKAYLINVELSPDLKPHSHFSTVAERVGAKMHHIVEHILEQA